jgi:hypothetical protein
MSRRNHSNARARWRVCGILSPTRSGVNLATRLAAIDTTLDDLQSSLEAGLRAATRVRRDAQAVDQRLTGPHGGRALVGSLVRHVKELQSCTRDQREALMQLRRMLAKLRLEMERGCPVVPAAEAADATRKGRPGSAPPRRKVTVRASTYLGADPSFSSRRAPLRMPSNE